jgi:hypothetical protein
VHVGFEALQRHADIPVRDVISFVVAEVTSLDQPSETDLSVFD